MLETVIKRDGTREPANPSKINKWMQWGSVELRKRVEFSTAVTAAVSRCGKEVKSQDLQMYIIDELVRQGDWAHSLLAGRLFAVYLHKAIHGDRIPTVGEKMAQLSAVGLGTYMNYSTDDLNAIEDMINHERDYDMAEFQIKYIRGKYALQNHITGEEYETPQFVYMRMAMELSEDEPVAQRLVHVKNYYDHFSLGRISAPTPNFNNLGTPHRGFASCCVYKAADNIPSLAAGDHIAYMMTANSAGVGGFLATRTSGDPVRNGAIVHQGKLPYHDLQGRVVKANRQGSRGGALTTYYCAYDPEVIPLTVAQNARTPISKQIRTINFAMSGNAWLAKKATFRSVEDRKVFLFTQFNAPELFRLFFTGDTEAFAREYVRLELDETFEKKYIDARQIVVTAQTQRFEVGTLFFFNADEANRHTPFKDPIYSSNLCTEIMLPTEEYESITDLYSSEDHGRGEVAMCSLGGLVPSNIKNDTMYRSAAYYVLKMIDKCIHKSYYPLPHVAMTAKARMSAGVGIVGLAHYLAQRGLKYSSQEGRDEIHRVAERHAYILIEQSLKISKERGLAPWMHKTKWPEGWLPIDTYKKTIDKVVTVGLQYDWEDLRKKIIENGGIGHSVLITHMPTESSSKAVGMPNSVLPIRSLSMLKTDGSNAVDWVAKDSDILGDHYENAYTINSEALLMGYGILQKFADQGLSADQYSDRRTDQNVYTSWMVQNYVDMFRYGLKSAYYQNSNVSSQKPVVVDDQSEGEAGLPLDVLEAGDDRGCGSGGCTL